MITFIILLSCISLGFAIRAKIIRDREEDIGIIFWIGGSATVVCTFLIVALCMMVSIAVGPSQIEQKIAMYQEENQRIETSVNIAVNEYFRHEEKIYDEMSNVDAVTMMLICFPELTSDELVKKQIELYQENNEKIRELKEEKINLTRKKFILYFGY